MSRFLISTFAEEGFSFPAVGLGRHLANAGHAVAMISDTSGRELLEENDILCIEAEGDEAISRRVGTWGDQESIACHLRIVKRAIQSFHPDVLVVSALTLGGLLAREQIGIPTAVLGFASYLFPRAPASPKPEEAIERLRWWRYTETLKTLEAARARAGLPSPHEDWKATTLLGDRFLLRTVPALEEGCAGLPEAIRLVGPCLWEPRCGDAAMAALIEIGSARGLPLIYAQVGRSFKERSLWPVLVDAFATEDVTVVVSLTRSDVLPGTIPRNFLVAPSSRQSLVLESAEAVVADGHSTVVLGAVSQGVPCVLSPNGSGTEEIAYMFARTGAAQILARPHLTGESLRVATCALLGDPHRRQVSSELARIVSNPAGFEAAALAVEELCKSRV